jgi:hypothetical protein
MLSVKYMGKFICAVNRRLSESDCRTLIDHLEVLTYMSIREEWKKLLEECELFRLAPLDGDTPARTVLLSSEMRELLEREMEEGEEANRRSRLLATLQNIVAGRGLVVCLEPYSARKAVIGRLDPIEESVFDIRCQKKPAVRVFCRFLETDVLFAVTCRPRSAQMNWLGWLPLGMQPKRWKEGIRATIREWVRLFPAHEPVKGESLGDYLSNATCERTRRRH